MEYMQENDHDLDNIFLFKKGRNSSIGSFPNKDKCFLKVIIK
jgi:hypothetical protein